MSFLNKHKLGLFFAGAAIATIFAVQGCSSSDDSAQNTPSGGKANNGGSGGASAAGKGGTSSGTAGKTGTGGSGNSGNEAGGGNTPGAGGEGGDMGGGEAGAGACDGPNGCYSCTPTNSTQFANHCVTGGCPATFDNTTLSKLNLVGTL